MLMSRPEIVHSTPDNYEIIFKPKIARVAQLFATVNENRANNNKKITMCHIMIACHKWK